LTSFQDPALNCRAVKETTERYICFKHWQTTCFP